MKKRILFCVILIICLGGCASMQCYEMQEYPTVCIVDTFSLEDEMMEYLEQGLSLTITQTYHLGINRDIVTSFYVKDKNTLYTKNDPEVIFTQLWYIKNKTLPNWSLKNIRFLEIKDIANFLNKNYE